MEQTGLQFHENGIPVNSHALCINLTPVDQRHRLHESRTISDT